VGRVQAGLVSGPYFSSTMLMVLLWAGLMVAIGLALLQMMSMQDKLVSLEEEVSRLRSENLHAFARLEEVVGELKIEPNRDLGVPPN